MSKQATNVIILGPQASGKGTQAELLAEKLGIPHVSLGDVFRREVAHHTKLGELLDSYMKKGMLVPEKLNDEIVEKILQDHHLQNPQEGILLDGYPRTMHQANFLDMHLSIDVVVVLQVPDKISIQRIEGRRVCNNGHDYHELYKPPKKEGICDVDGLPLQTRDDDKQEAIQRRLAIYHEQTEPIIAHYQKKGIVLFIDGTKTISEVTQAIFSHFS